MPPPPEPKRPPTRIGKLHEFFIEQRECQYTLEPPHGLGLGPVPPDEPPNFEHSAAVLQQWDKRWPDLPEDERDLRIRCVMTTWLETPYWASPKPDKRTGKVTPYPWGAFLSEEQFAQAFAKAFPEEAAA